MKLRKKQKKQVFRADINRKRLRKKLANKGPLRCPEIKDIWLHKRSAVKNLESMGLVSDPNKSLKRSNLKRELIAKIASTTSWTVELNTRQDEKKIPEKAYVAELLEKEAYAPREKLFQLPLGQVEWITYLMDKYGTDFKAMARDKRNYYQETWKQIRAKIKTFMRIPEQYGKYLESRGLLDESRGLLDESIENKHFIESDDEL